MPRHDPAEEDLRICNVLKDLRIGKGLTQKELAERIGTKQSAISDLEQGTMPSIPTLRRVCKGLGVKLIIQIEQWELTKVYEF